MNDLRTQQLLTQYVTGDHERRIQQLEKFQIGILLGTIGTLATTILTFVRLGHI